MLETTRLSPMDSPTAPAPAALGQLGPYVLLREAGRGAAATVYEAYDERMDRHVAVKVLERSHVVAGDGTDSASPVDASPSTSSDDSGERAVARFRREARTVASVSHPNIVQVFDIGEMGGRHYLVMELLPGQTLRERLDKGPVAFDEAVSLLAQIAGALDALHARGIIHRDLKPSNVMVLPDGCVKVLDFGVARRAKSEEITLTIAGSLVGSPAYMAPEQVQGASATPASDIWALGVLAYELLQGASPFGGNNIAAVLYRVTHEPPMPLSRFGQEVNAVISKALDKNPPNRFTTAGNFIQALRTAGQTAQTRSKTASPAIPAAHVPVQTPKVSPSLPLNGELSEPAPVRLHSMRVVGQRERMGISPVTIAASVALAAIAGVGYLAWSRSHSPSPSMPTVARSEQAAQNPAKQTQAVGNASSNLSSPRIANRVTVRPSQTKQPRRVATRTKPVAPVISVATPKPQVVQPVVKPSSAVPSVMPGLQTASRRIVSKPSVVRVDFPAASKIAATPASTVAPTNMITPAPPAFRPTPSASPAQPQPELVKPKPVASTKPSPTLTPKPATLKPASPTPVSTPAPTTPAITTVTGLTGRWQGNIGKQAAILQITQHDGDTWSGSVSLQTPTGTVRVPVSGTFNPETGRVVFEASDNTNEAQIGTQKGRLIGAGRMGGLATMQVEESGFVKARVFPWSFGR